MFSPESLFASDSLADLLTIKEAAALLQLSPSSIRSYIRQGLLTPCRVPDVYKLLIQRAQVMNLLEPMSR